MDNEIEAQSKDLSISTNLNGVTGTSLLLVLLADEIYHRKIKSSYLWKIGKWLLPESCRLLHRLQKK